MKRNYGGLIKAICTKLSRDIENCLLYRGVSCKVSVRYLVRYL